MQNLTDTIVAPITASGPAAVAVIRISGSQAFNVANSVFNNWSEPTESHKALYGTFITGDDGLALPFSEGHSYTGDETVEFSIHGSPASVDSLVSQCIKAGARMATPGEFTLRAFMNGRLDLSQAEGVRATVDAQTSAQLRMANQLRQGNLTDQVKLIRKLCIQVLAMVEATTDFSEEIGDLNHEEALEKTSEAIALINNLLQTEQLTRLFQTGARLAILGLPNAGKSSLLNALLKQDRAIVTPVAGTTRDTVEEIVDLNGLPVRIIDTAGLRETPDEVEKIGVERAIQAASNADLVLYLYDASQGWTSEDERLRGLIQRPTIVVANKSDLTPDLPKNTPISAKKGTGLNHLIDQISNHFRSKNESPSFLLDRHYELLKQTKNAIEESETTFNSPELPDDLSSVALRQAVRLLGEITGETASADIIDQIFSEFCIGK